MSRPQLPDEIRSLLKRLRRRIRWYVWIDGVAAVVVLLAAAGWVGLFIDWFWEPSPQARIVIGSVVGLALVWVAYRKILSRAFVQIADASLAMLVERRFKRFDESLLTSVQLIDSREPREEFNEAMLRETSQAAVRQATEVPLSEIFNLAPLLRNLGAAVLLVGAIILFGVFSRDAFGFYLDRIGLSSTPWPRRTRLTVSGFPNNDAGIRSMKVAKLRSFELRVQADNTLPDPPPSRVEIRYRQAGGGRGRAEMRRIGEAIPGRDAAQEYAYTFKDVYESFSFDVLGGDDRVVDLHVELVENPQIVRMTLLCDYPAYIGRARRELDVTGSMRIARGTTVRIRAEANKPLAEVKLLDPDQAEPLVISGDRLAETEWGSNPNRFEVSIGALDADRILLFVLTDTDGIETREPYRLSLLALSDEAP